PFFHSSLHQRRQRDEIGSRMSRRAWQRLRVICARLSCGGLEASDARAQLPVLVPQFPVRLSQPFEPPGDSPRTQKCANGKKEGCADEQPLDAQQNPYLSERLATVSTACHNTAGLPEFPTPMVLKQKTVLIVDDDEGTRDTLTAILKREYRVLRVSSGEAALPILNREDVDLMLLDVRLPGISGFEVLRIVKENYALIEVLMISAITEVETAVQAMKHGAYHYVTKEFDYDQLRALVRNASERQDLNRQVLTLSAQIADQTEREFIVGPS